MIKIACPVGGQSIEDVVHEIETRSGEKITVEKDANDTPTDGGMKVYKITSKLTENVRQAMVELGYPIAKNSWSNIVN